MRKCNHRVLQAVELWSEINLSINSSMPEPHHDKKMKRTRKKNGNKKKQNKIWLKRNCLTKIVMRFNTSKWNDLYEMSTHSVLNLWQNLDNTHAFTKNRGGKMESIAVERKTNGIDSHRAIWRDFYALISTSSFWLWL